MKTLRDSAAEITTVWPVGFLILQAIVIVLSGAVCLLVSRWARRRSPIARCGRMLTSVTAVLVLPAYLLGVTTQVRVFFPIGCLLYTLGCWMPLQVLVAIRAIRPRGLAWLAGPTAAAALLTTLWALFVEPERLETRRETVRVAALTEPEVRIALVADIQAVGVGARERAVVAAVNAFDPHFVVLAGDYVHIHLLQDAPIAGVRSMLRALRPRIATVAVNSDSDGPEQRARLFEGLPITYLENAGCGFDVGAARLYFAGLDHRDPRFDRALRSRQRGDVVVAVAHAPDPLWFLEGDMRESGACLAVCGHTHGGQLQVPGFGPPMTLSHVPRYVAAGGRFETPAGTPLILSRGIGMEGGFAPRFRLNCPPEVVLVTLVPART